MKQYIMFCWSTRCGGQIYVNSKVKYLEENGWETMVFTPNENEGDEIIWDNLKKFNNGISRVLIYAPEFWNKSTVMKTIDWMVSFVQENADEVIIESHTDTVAEWGELLAKRINAKHFCFLLDERLEEYRAKEFLYFKYLRGEVAGIHSSSLVRLFSNYKEIDKNNSPVLCASNSGAVQDYYSDGIEKIKNLDWNIAYIGRSKRYVENIVNGVDNFAKAHLDKEIQFIVLGAIENLRYKKFTDNVKVLELGFMTPIPRSFFQHLDVVIAGAGCATLSVRENIPTIVADASTFLSDGILGYQTHNSLFSENKGKSFEDSLEDVLVRKIHLEMDFSLSPPKDYKLEYKKHFDFIQKSVQTKEYFDIENNPQPIAIKDRVRFMLNNYAPIIMMFYHRLKAMVQQVLS